MVMLMLIWERELLELKGVVLIRRVLGILIVQLHLIPIISH